MANTILEEKINDARKSIKDCYDALVCVLAEDTDSCNESYVDDVHRGLIELQRMKNRL